MKNNQFFSAIILAAGNSSRIGGSTRKPFIPLLGQPIIYYSLRAFENCSDIQEIIIVGKEDDKAKIGYICQTASITKFKTFVLGGETRQQSAFAGVNAASAGTTHFIIHDAARALISAAIISRVIKEAIEHGAASAYIPSKDTIKLKNQDGLIKITLPRDQLAIMQTPQAFEKKLYLKAMHKALKDQSDYTDDCQLVENLGEVYACKGDYTNIKITTKEDLILAEILLNQQ
ncbi:MAG: 2-C-methyl-D-erythritol 4-phosphate cytidylyltransferase [Oscillospiraceae bacterium]|jgi:2-C-methyl-D-erythritol 4-phosphate cytidylyltransferase|nr:2-C-methyl-D-erythritol 4-phosphate cytidylyltransferase [Oscillospiraceae bacterium]